MRRRAFTMVEVLLGSTLMAILMGALLSMFVFVANRSERSANYTAASTQCERLLDAIEPHIRNSTEIVVGTGGSGPTLRCTLTQGASDLDGDGVPDRYNLHAVSNMGFAKYGKGRRVTYYRSDSTGSPTATVTRPRHVWRAWMFDDTAPSSTNRDTAFGLVNGGRSAWDLVTALTFTHDATNGLVTVTATTATADRLRGKSVTVSRTIPYLKGEY